MKNFLMIIFLISLIGLSFRSVNNYESPRNPLAQMELCTTKKCPNNINSGRFGCARSCNVCDVQLGCQKWHGGTDLSAAQNTNFKAIFSGKTVLQNFSKTWGFYIVIESTFVKDINGLSYDTVSLIYCHLNPGQTIPAYVHQGDILGLTGNTGNALDEKPHLHIEAYDGKFVNSNRSNALDAELFFSTSFGGNDNNSACHPNMIIADDDCCGDLPQS